MTRIPPSRARALLSFTGIAPLGVFVVVHLATTATGLGGAARFERVFDRGPWLVLLTLVLVALPLAFHAGYGAYVLATKPHSVALPATWPRLRRIAAYVMLAFLVAHVVELPLRGWIGSLGPRSLFDVTSAHLSSTFYGFPFVALGYLVGLAATLFHFATSIWTFVTAWGLVVETSARRRLAMAIAVVAIALFAVGGNTVVFFATGTRLFGPGPAPFVPDGPAAAKCPSG